MHYMCYALMLGSILALLRRYKVYVCDICWSTDVWVLSYAFESC